jgi:hypothetical protein
MNFDFKYAVIIFTLRAGCVAGSQRTFETHDTLKKVSFELFGRGPV